MNTTTDWTRKLAAATCTIVASATFLIGAVGPAINGPAGQAEVAQATSLPLQRA